MWHCWETYVAFSEWLWSIVMICIIHVGRVYRFGIHIVGRVTYNYMFVVYSQLSMWSRVCIGVCSHVFVLWIAALTTSFVSIENFTVVKLLLFLSCSRHVLCLGMFMIACLFDAMCFRLHFQVWLFVLAIFLFLQHVNCPIRVLSSTHVNVYWFILYVPCCVSLASHYHGVSVLTSACYLSHVWFVFDACSWCVSLNACSSHTSVMPSTHVCEY